MKIVRLGIAPSWRPRRAPLGSLDSWQDEPEADIDAAQPGREPDSRSLVQRHAADGIEIEADACRKRCHAPQEDAEGDAKKMVRSWKHDEGNSHRDDPPGLRGAAAARRD